MKNNPKVGIGVIVRKEGKILLGKRKGSHDSEKWSFPGGHLDFFEGFEDCAKREVKEETDLEINNLKLITVTNDLFCKENKHYVTIFMESDYKSGVLNLMEPEKCYGWLWFKWNRLPKSLSIPVKHFIKTDYDPFKNYLV